MIALSGLIAKALVEVSPDSATVSFPFFLVHSYAPYSLYYIPLFLSDGVADLIGYA